MSILTELKKLTKKKNATVVSQALPDSLDGDGSSEGGGGANVLTLYAGKINNIEWAFKDPECTESYTSYSEAKLALENAQLIIVKGTPSSMLNEGTYTVTCKSWGEEDDEKWAIVQVCNGNFQQEFVIVRLYIESGSDEWKQ